jgi:HD-like signal output (HDOD) protein
MAVRTPSHIDSRSVSIPSIIDVASRPHGSPKALVSVLEARPELARWIIDTINSERFSLAITVTSVRHAMVVIGQNTFRQLVLVTATLSLSI